MRVYKKESERLKKVQSIVKSRFSHLGINKKQEITRLLYEISKKESTPPLSIIQDLDLKNFDKIKQCLLKRRYPFAYLNNKNFKVYLPDIKLAYSSALKNPEDIKFYPKRLFIEKSASHSNLASRFIKSFPNASVFNIKSLKDYLGNNRDFAIEDYNKRCDTVFITSQIHDLFKRCPCTKNAIGCNYHIFNLSFGCMFECTYCYLQEYTNVPGLIFPANIDRFFKAFNSYKRPGMRIGTGEFSDSLMLDHITEYSLPIVDFFKKYPKITFEFKTKSLNIDNLLKIDHAGNIVVAWSMNPQKIIDENEFFTPSLSKRILGAKQCAEAGYKVSIHFDPVIYFSGWQKGYKKVIELLFNAIKPKHIAWISIGTLRFNPNVKKTIEMRFPGNKILDQELVIGFDNKLRYPYPIRHQVYDFMLKTLSKHSGKMPIYLCMEETSMWKDLRNYLKLP